MPLIAITVTLTHLEFIKRSKEVYFEVGIKVSVVRINSLCFASRKDFKPKMPSIIRLLNNRNHGSTRPGE